MASAVLRAPSERIFGMEIVGRHHDPFTVMQQFERPISVGMYSQPVTDITGALLSRVIGPVAAYNWLILLSFPLAAATAYLLARHLALSPARGDRRRAGVRVLSVSSGARGVSSAHRANAMDAVVPARVVALPRCGHSSARSLSLASRRWP